MRHEEILHRCFRCGWCKFPNDYQDLNCPSYLRYRFETFSPGGRMWLIRAWLNNEIQTSPRLQKILYSCATCNNCVEHCAFPEFRNDILNSFIAAREELVADGMVPPEIRDYLKSINLYGNPYKLPESDRAKWADGMDVPFYNGQEYLFFAGDVGSFDERAQKMTRALEGLLKSKGVSFGILGEKERTDGNEVRAIGEKMLFENIAKQNINLFQELGVKKIITLSPHSYNTLKNDYQNLNGRFEVYHYSQILSRIMKQDDYREQSRIKVTYHDPCYLGRHNQEYRSARKILAQIPGVEFTEMDRNKADALCCGGGGGNFFTDFLGGSVDSPARVRVREAMETGADVMAVACPQCLKMFEDAIKAENLDDRLRIKDLSEIVMERLG